MVKSKTPKPLEFHWDQYNINKSWNKHHVDYRECEQTFKNRNHIFEDIKHSQVENRYNLIGTTDRGRHLHLTFTIRDNQIRVISARDMHIKERNKYEEKT